MIKRNAGLFRLFIDLALLIIQKIDGLLDTFINLEFSLTHNIVSLTHNMVIILDLFMDLRFHLLLHDIMLKWVEWREILIQFNIFIFLFDFFRLIVLLQWFYSFLLLLLTKQSRYFDTYQITNQLIRLILHDLIVFIHIPLLTLLLLDQVLFLFWFIDLYDIIFFIAFIIYLI